MRMAAAWRCALNDRHAFGYSGGMNPLSRDEITRLSPPERLALIGELWDSMSDADLGISPAQQRELKRRLASFDQDKAHAVTWEHLKAELAARAS